MNYNKFLISILIRILLISANSFFLIYFYTKDERLFTLILFVLIMITQIWALYRYVGKSNRDLARFLLYLEEKDTSIRFPDKYSDKYFDEIAKRYSSIIEYFKKIKIEKEQKDRFVNILIEHINIGLLAFDEKGKIIYLNKSALQLLNIGALININHLEIKEKALCDKIKKQKAGENLIIEFSVEGESRALSFNKTIVKQTNNKEISLLTIQDIKTELEENELQSYQKLIRVITHEMMNSLTPITTLTSTIKRNLSLDKKAKSPEKLLDENIEDSITSSEMIEERSKGLIDFIQKYRQFTNLPKPKIEDVKIENLLNSVRKFIEIESGSNIKIITESEPKNLLIKLDQKLIEQVLINLLKNAVQAIGNKSKGEIFIQAIPNEIKISDNGKGIEDEIKDEIFVPFFTTKENGSGVGLSLCKQIMQLHKGKISVKSKKGEGSTFTLKF